MESIDTLKIIELLKELYVELGAEGVDPTFCIQGFLTTGDPAYLRVHTGGNRELKRQIVKLGEDIVLKAVINAALFGK